MFQRYQKARIKLQTPRQARADAQRIDLSHQNDAGGHPALIHVGGCAAQAGRMVEGFIRRSTSFNSIERLEQAARPVSAPSNRGADLDVERVRFPHSASYPELANRVQCTMILDTGSVSTEVGLVARGGMPGEIRAPGSRTRPAFPPGPGKHSNAYPDPATIRKRSKIEFNEVILGRWADATSACGCDVDRKSWECAALG